VGGGAENLLTDLSTNDVGFEVLAAVVTKGSVFWDITPCIPLEVN
jgi:hypothetical protein